MKKIALVDDELSFADESDEVSNAASKKETWKILIVDDEHSIHDVTKLALGGFEFADKELEFISAFSGEEAKTKILQHPDTAVVLLDVVMENDHAGRRQIHPRGSKKPVGAYRSAHRTTGPGA